MATLGCQVVGPDYSGINGPHLKPSYAAESSVELPTQADAVAFWTSFSDPKLDRLIGQALCNNLSVKIAMERIIESRSRVNLSGGQLLPDVNSSNGYAFSKQSLNAFPFVGPNGSPFSLFHSGWDASWELDLFGRLERSIEASEARLHSRQADLAVVQQTLTADVAMAYFTIRQLQQQIQLHQHSLALNAAVSESLEDRFELLDSVDLDREQLRGTKLRTRAKQVDLEKDLRLAFHRLSILLGEPPSNAIQDFVGKRPLPENVLVPIHGLPANLLQKRPDIQSAEAKVHAATAEVGIATADLYPSLTLIGNISLQARDTTKLFQSESLAFALGPSLRWNILHFGRVCDNIDIQDSKLRQALINYQSVVLNSVREVEDCLVQLDALGKRREVLAESLDANSRAVELSLEGYRDGTVPFQRVADSQENMLRDSLTLVSVRAGQVAQAIRLFKACGGAWPGTLHKNFEASVESTDRFNGSSQQINRKVPIREPGFRVLEIDEPPSNRNDGSTPWDQGAIPGKGGVKLSQQLPGLIPLKYNGQVQQATFESASETRSLDEADIEFNYFQPDLAKQRLEKSNKEILVRPARRPVTPKTETPNQGSIWNVDPLGMSK